MTKGIGNMYDPDEEECEQAETVIQKFIESHPEVNQMDKFKEYFTLPTEDNLNDEYYSVIDGPLEFAYDIGLSGGEFDTRVMESFKVEYQLKFA